MAHQFMEQQLVECLETSPDDESLEDYIEEEEVETIPISTVYSNKLIDLGLSVESETHRKEEELKNRQGTSQESVTQLDEVKAGLNYLQNLSLRRIKSEIEENSELYDERSEGSNSGMSQIGFSNTGTCSMNKSSSSSGKTKTVTVFSQNSPQRRDSQGSSSELPSYVKKMMEKDASLRRLLKTGSVTISQINQPARVNRKKISNITITKTSGGTYSSKRSSNGSGLRNSLNSSQPGPSTVIPIISELDWSNYPAAQKFLELVRLAESEKEKKETFIVPGISPVEQPVNHFVKQVAANRTASSSLQFLQSRFPVTKPINRFSPSTSKQALLQQQLHRPLLPPPKQFSSTSVASPLRMGKFMSHMVQPVQPIKVQKSRAPRGSNSRQVRLEEEIDPTRFLEVSLLEEDHTTISDEHRRKYKCPHCPKAFCWSTDLKRHILTHTGERPFICIYCSANFTRKFLMQKHVRKYHPGMECETVGKPNTTVTVSNGKKGGTVAATNGFFNVPGIVKEELITPEDYDEIPNQMQVEYKFNHQGITFKEEMYDNNTHEMANMFAMPERTAFQEVEDNEEDEDDENAPHPGIICKEEMLEDNDEDDFIEFPEPQQFFSEEVEEDNLNDEDIEEEQSQQHLLQKYSLGKKLTNTNNSSRSSSPIVINVFSSNTPISERAGEGGDFDSAASASTAPRRLSQSLVNQLARASAKLKGEMVKTTSAREALRLLVRR